MAAPQRNGPVVIRRVGAAERGPAIPLGRVEGPPPLSTSIAEAERRLGVPLLVLRDQPGARLDAVTYHAPLAAPDGRVLGSAGGSVELRYSVPGGSFQLFQAREPGALGGPFVLTLKAGTPAIWRVEAIADEPYALCYLPDGDTVRAVRWETLGGIGCSLTTEGPGLGRHDLAELLPHIR